jgi:hypothetical protein
MLERKQERDFSDKDQGFLFWNPIGGRCEYKCRYCRTRGKGRPFLRAFVDFNLEAAKCVSVALGYAEMWGPWIPSSWIEKILAHCHTHDAIYTFMSKNPRRYHDFVPNFPDKTILGATIETNREYRLSKAPPTRERMEAMASLPRSISKSTRLSPLADFDLDEMLLWMERIKPTDVRVSQEWYGTKMARPTAPKTKELIMALVKIAGVVVLEPGNLIVGGTDPRAKGNKVSESFRW